MCACRCIDWCIVHSNCTCYLAPFTSPLLFELFCFTNPIYIYRETVGKDFTFRDVGKCRLIGQRSEDQLAGGALIDTHKDGESIRFPFWPQGDVLPVQSGSTDSRWRDSMLALVVVNEKGWENRVFFHRYTIGEVNLEPNAFHSCLRFFVPQHNGILEQGSASHLFL